MTPSGHDACATTRLANTCNDESSLLTSIPHLWGCDRSEVVFRWHRAAVHLLVACLMEWPGVVALPAIIKVLEAQGLFVVHLNQPHHNSQAHTLQNVEAAGMTGRLREWWIRMLQFDSQPSMSEGCMKHCVARVLVQHCTRNLCGTALSNRPAAATRAPQLVPTFAPLPLTCVQCCMLRVDTEAGHVEAMTMKSSTAMKLLGPAIKQATTCRVQSRKQA